VTDLDILYRAMLLDPWDDLARMACCDEYEMVTGSRPDLLTEWSGPLAEFVVSAEALFRQHPIREVMLTGCTPRCDPLQSMLIYGWLGDVHTPPIQMDDYTYIPIDILDHMNRERCMPHSEYRFWYSSREAAQAALSQAALRYGRSLAGLPPIPDRLPQPTPA
jgi:hypothetical protein